MKGLLFPKLLDGWWESLDDHDGRIDGYSGGVGSRL